MIITLLCKQTTWKEKVHSRDGINIPEKITEISFMARSYSYSRK